MNNIPKVGKTVLYTMTENDCEQVKTQRGLRQEGGNIPAAGQVYPMVITRAWGDTPTSAVNGQVQLDGPDLLWVTSRSQGDGPGHWKVDFS